MVAGRAGERPELAPGRRLRRGLEPSEARAPQQDPPSRASGSVRARPRVPSAPARALRRGVLPAVRGRPAPHQSRHLFADPHAPAGYPRRARRRGQLVAPGASECPDRARPPPRPHGDRARARRGADAREGDHQAAARRAGQGVGGDPRCPRRDRARLQWRVRRARELRFAGPAAQRADLPARRLACRRRRGQLPTLLRRQQPRRHPDGASRGLRGHPRAGHAAPGRGQGRRGQDRSPGWPLRSGRIFPPPPGRRHPRHREAAASRSRPRRRRGPRRRVPPESGGRARCSVGAAALDRRREDPHVRGDAARLVGGGGHHGLRLPDLGQRSLRRPQHLAPDVAHLRPLRGGRPAHGRSELRGQAPHHAGLDGRRDHPARPAPRSHLGAQSAVARLHPGQPRPRHPGGHRGLSRLSHLCRRRRRGAERPRSRLHRARDRRGRAAEPHRQRLRLRFPTRCPAPAASRGERRPRAGGATGLRHALSADDGAHHR